MSSYSPINSNITNFVHPSRAILTTSAHHLPPQSQSYQWKTGLHGFLLASVGSKPWAFPETRSKLIFSSDHLLSFSLSYHAFNIAMPLRTFLKELFSKICMSHAQLSGNPDYFNSFQVSLDQSSKLCYEYSILLPLL